MTDLLGALQAEHGYLTPRASLTRAVGETDELRRIRDMARRQWAEDPELDLLVRLLTEWLKYDHTKCPTKCEGCAAVALKPAQAQFLREVHDLRAGCAPFRVGGGKTLASLLAPTVLGSTRPLLVVPAALVEKTLTSHRQYSRHWRVMPIRVVSYEWLGHPNQLNWLNEYKPDLILADEAHKLKSPSSKVAKRIGRYKRAHPAVVFVPLTGTPTGRSIREYWHYLRWAMGSFAPVPADPLEMQAWAYALDEKVPELARFEPGALATLSPVQHEDPLTQARLAYRDRFTSTPGIVATLEDVPPMGLRIEARQVALPPALEATIQRVRDTWQTPAGEDFSLALDLWRHCRTLGCGLFYKWEPAAPEPWMRARRAWYQWAREHLKYARSFDSVVHLIQRIDEYEGGPALLRAWQDVEDSFKPNPVPVWVDTTVLELAKTWLKEGGPRLCWVEQRAFGDRLARETGLPFFAEEGLDQRGRLIDECEGPSIASISSCREGHNLQNAWSENLVVCPPSRGDRWEQLLGRTHRDGQAEDEVQCLVLLTCQESVQCLEQARLDAKFVQDSTGQAQKLIYGNWFEGP